MYFHYLLDFWPCHKDNNSSGLGYNAQRDLAVVHQDFALWVDFSGLSSYLHFLLLTTTPFDWCYDGGKTPFGSCPTQVFSTCHPPLTGEKWRKFWIYKTNLIRFPWWHNFHYTTRRNRILPRERWKRNISALIFTMDSLCCSTGHTR